jgi:hypothetical protein
MGLSAYQCDHQLNVIQMRSKTCAELKKSFDSKCQESWKTSRAVYKDLSGSATHTKPIHLVMISNSA